jgi:energy-coupling factor transporter ATP-binding protein EcfA2
MTPVIETRGLSWCAHRDSPPGDCAMTVPRGQISALAGPAGAGKTTLLRLLAVLAKPTADKVAVLGGTRRQDPALPARDQLPYPADAAHIGFGAQSHRCWDAASGRVRLKPVNIPLNRAAGDRSIASPPPGGASRVADDKVFRPEGIVRWPGAADTRPRLHPAPEPASLAAVAAAPARRPGAGVRR